jgi:sRNA-binding regulator protein Hfq
MRPAKRPSKQVPPAKRHRTDPRVRARADELHTSGMPFQMAMAVALGRVSLNDALERLARQERVQKMMDDNDLSRALATQIVIGHASLETVLSRRRMQDHREQNRLRSCLETARLAGRPIALEVHGKQKVAGIVSEVAAYSVTIQPEEGGEPVEVHKLQLKYAWDPKDWKKVRKGVKRDKDLSAAPREPIERPQDRYTCSDKRLFRYMDRKVPVTVTLLEGEQVKGTVSWFGRYEFGLILKDGETEVTIFRHCLHDISES